MNVALVFVHIACHLQLLLSSFFFYPYVCTFYKALAPTKLSDFSKVFTKTSNGSISPYNSGYKINGRPVTTGDIKHRSGD